MAECIHGDGPAWAKVRMLKGCVAFPDDTVQELCMNHIITDGSRDGQTELLECYVVECPGKCPVCGMSHPTG